MLTLLVRPFSESYIIQSNNRSVMTAYGYFFGNLFSLSSDSFSRMNGKASGPTFRVSNNES